MKKLLMLLIGVFLLTACTDELDVDLEEGQVRLVVEGRLVRQKEGVNSGYQFIRLSTTAPYFQNEQTPAARGATVEVLEIETNVAYVFAESTDEPGIYEAFGMTPTVGFTYQLEIRYESSIYRAAEEMLAVASIDRLGQEFREETIFRDEGIGLLLDYQDPEGIENYYHWQTYRNDTLLIRADVGNQFNLISSDEFYDGLKVVDFELAGDFSFMPGDRGLVRQYAISKEAYDYYRIFYEQAVGLAPGGGDVVPATLRGNVQNISNDSLYPLGYFEASEVSEREIIVR